MAHVKGMCFLHNRDLVINVPGLPSREHTRSRVAYPFLPYYQPKPSGFER